MSVFDLALVVQEDFDFAVAFEPGDGINRYTRHHQAS